MTESNLIHRRIETASGFIFINVLRNILGIIRNKIIAVFHGTSSIGLLGQFLNFDGLLGKVVLFGTTASLVNTYHDAEKLNTTKSVVVFANLCLIIISGIINLSLVLIFASYLANLIYLDISYVPYIYLGVGLNILYVLMTFFELVFQAQHEFKKLFYARLIGLGAGFITIFPMVYYLDIKGVIFNIAVIYLLTISYILLTLKIIGLFSFRSLMILFKEIKLSFFKKLFKITITDLSRSIIIYGSLLFVRIIIIQTLGEIDAGYYHAVLSISNYLNIILEGFMVYYYPVVSAIHNESDLNKEININFEILFYIISPVVILIGIFSQPLMTLFYSNDFNEVSQYLILLVATKILYLYYYFFSINLLAKLFLKKFLLVEVIRSICLVIITYAFIRVLHFKGAIYAVMVTEIVSIVTIWILKRKITKFNLTRVNRKNVTVLLMILIFLQFKIVTPVYAIIVILIVSFIFFDIRKYYLVVDMIKGFYHRQR